jgi:hypothetical protein
VKFGGHQTFFIREGWLYKGLSLLREAPELVDDPHVADYLGVGRNMAQSIFYWMKACGLAEQQTIVGKKRTGPLQQTDFAKQIWKYDKYFVDEGTWWLIHINLVFAKDYATTWNWFFNYFQRDRFDRGECIESLVQWQAMDSGHSQSPFTLERDVAVLLLSYATHVPPLNKDPEEEIDCPLRDLGLINNYRHLGYFQLLKLKRNIPSQIMMYALNKSYQLEIEGNCLLEKKLLDIIRSVNSPTRLFLMSNDDFYESLSLIEKESNSNWIELRGLAGERMIRMSLNKDANSWVEGYYESREKS